MLWHSEYRTRQNKTAQNITQHNTTEQDSTEHINAVFRACKHNGREFKTVHCTVRTLPHRKTHHNKRQNRSLQFRTIRDSAMHRYEFVSGNQFMKDGRKNIMKKEEKEIVIKPIITSTCNIRIVGDTDLILNKMNDRVSESLLEVRRDEAKTVREANPWEDIITAMHWRDDYQKGNYSEKMLKDMLKNNAPCIHAFGLKKSFGQAVVRNEIDTYATKFDACMNVIASGNLIPIKFAEHHVDEKLMSPKKGKPVLARQNRFTGWEATFKIQYVEGGAYSINQIVQVINLAGFGLGIGSGRPHGFGRYHVAGVE